MNASKERAISNFTVEIGTEKKEGDFLLCLESAGTGDDVDELVGNGGLTHSVELPAVKQG